jgi:hypothetical protein
MALPPAKIFAEIARDGKINKVSLTNRSPDSKWVEISPEQLLAVFEDMEPRYWENDQVTNKPTHEEISAYHETLGRFIQAFASTEGTINGALREFSKVSGPVARAIFSGTRTDAAKQYITRILDAENYKQGIKDELKSAFDQLGLINSARNDIIHYGTKFEEADRFIVTNEARAHLPSRVSTVTVSTRILEQMMADLNKISMILLVQAMDLTNPESATYYRQALAPILQRPWQYKPTKPVPHE